MYTLCYAPGTGSLAPHITLREADLPNWAKPMRVDLTGLDALLAWRKRAAGRPAVQAALQAEGLAR